MTNPRRAELKAVQASLYVHPSKADQWVSSAIADTGVWEPVETDLIANLLQPGSTFVDIGAHVGYYSVIAGKIVGKAGSVIAFEPEVTTYELLVANIQLNHLQHVVKPYRLAAWDTREILYLREEDEKPGARWASNQPLGPAERNVEGTSLDEFLDAGQVVNVIKIDVDGGEYMVFQGMRDLLSRLTEVVILVEIVFPSPHARHLIDLIANLGLRSTLIDNHRGWLKPVSHNELVSHCADSSFHAVDLMLRKERTNPEPVVSAVISDYGDPEALRRSIETVSRQSPRCEVIVVPLGPTNSGEPESPNDYPEVRRLRLAANPSISLAISLAICVAEGSNVMLIDADRCPDHPDIDRAAALLDQNAGSVVVFSQGSASADPAALMVRVRDYENAGGFEDGWTDFDLLIRFIEIGMTAYSIAKGREKLLGLTVDEIPHLEVGHVGRSNGWTVRRDMVSNTDCLSSSEPGAYLEFEVPAGRIVQLVFARLDWCGVLEVTVGNRQPSRIDLFSSRRENQWSFRTEAPGNRGELVRVEMKISKERNPQSHGHEVWIKRILSLGPYR